MPEDLPSKGDLARTAEPDRGEAALEVLKAFRILVRAAQHHSQRVERLTGISGAQLWAIQEIADADGIRVGGLARRMALHQSTTSNILDGLEEKGLVRRTRSASDQRVVSLSLTDGGRDLLARAPHPTRGVMPTALRSMSGDDLGALRSALNAVIDRIADLDPTSALKPLPFNE